MYHEFFYTILLCSSVHYFHYGIYDDITFLGYFLSFVIALWCSYQYYNGGI